MAAKVNIVIDQGADLDKVIFRIKTTTGANVDISGGTANASLKVNYRAISSFDIPTVVLGSDGSITLQANGEFTGSIPAGRYVYDVVVTDNLGKKNRLVEGYCAVEPLVSNPA